MRNAQYYLEVKFRHIFGFAASDGASQRQTAERPLDFNKELAFILNFGIIV